MSGYEIKALRPMMPRREHPLSLCVYTDNRECLSYIPNPASFEEGGPVWSMAYGTNLPWRHEITGLLDTLEYLLSPDYTMADATKRLRELRAAYRDARRGEIPEHQSQQSQPPTAATPAATPPSITQVAAGNPSADATLSQRGGG